jgi:hypothetical protein
MSAGFCTLCSHHVDSFDGLTSCPKCGHAGVPCGDDEQYKHISINRHELKLLCIWAENYAHSIKDDGKNKMAPEVVYAIAARLKRNNPVLADKSLTMSDEFRALKDAGFEFTTNHPAHEEPSPNPNGKENE